MSFGEKYFRNDRVTGRKARGLQMEKIPCTCQTFFSLLSGRRKQTSCSFSFSTQIKKEVSLKILCCHNDTWFHLKLTILKPWVNQCIFLMEMFVLLMYYAFTPNSVFKLVPPNGSEPTWQTYVLYSDIFPVIYVNETICMVICPSTRFKSIVLRPGMNHLVLILFQNASYRWGALVPFWVLRHSFLSLTDC